ncbi:MAG: exosome complex RNA-binding protein Csl4 [Candidatus Heimdallarchaeota archaeon]|nr:exosome complex RNA-binding protein Csl4 [Candidatus Heimdallarchaeota archaeon]
MANSEIFDRTKDSNELVFPGTRLAVAEEFIAGPGTYSTDDYVYSSVAGLVIIDLEKHEITVMPKAKMTPVPKNNDIILGKVVNVSRQVITVSVFSIGNQEIYPTYTMVIHVSSVSREYLETIDEAICLGDVIRGKIIDSKTIPLQGSLIGSQLGVIQSSCSICGEKLNKIGRNKLKCSNCSNVEERKTAIDYGSSHLGFKL